MLALHSPSPFPPVPPAVGKYFLIASSKLLCTLLISSTFFTFDDDISCLVATAYEQRDYILHKFAKPPGLVVYGFRQLLVDKMKALQVAGWVQRRSDSMFGQIIYFRARGDVAALNDMETSVLVGAAQVDATDTPLWAWESAGSITTIHNIGPPTFIILDSTVGAVSGDGSDVRHDYKKEKAKLSSHGSSKSSH